MLQLFNRHNAKHQEGSVAADQVLSQLENSLEGKKDNNYKEKSAGQTCTCPVTSGHRNSCCSKADNKGMNTGNFCGNYRNKELTCGSGNYTELPVCCTSRAGDAHCCKAGGSCSNGCLNGGATNGAATPGISLAVCGCLDPPPVSEASTLYDEDMAKAMAEVASAASCSFQTQKNNIHMEDLPKIYQRFRCDECEVAGFELEDVTTVVEKDLKDDDALFAFVARAKSLRADSTIKDGNCIVSIRGTKNGANWWRNFAVNFRNGQEPDQAAFNEAGECEGCGIHVGYSNIYHVLKPPIVAALESLGCGAGSGQAVYATGHSMGAGIAALFIYDLQNNGFNMALSYTYESPRIGNQVFAQNFNNAFKPGRNVPMFRITHMRDLIVHFPLRNPNGNGGGYTHMGAEVYYGPAWDGEPDAQYRYVICGEGDDEDLRCANRYNSMDALSRPGLDHTQIPPLSGGRFDIDQDWCREAKIECLGPKGRWLCTE